VCYDHYLQEEKHCDIRWHDLEIQLSDQIVADAEKVASLFLQAYELCKDLDAMGVFFPTDERQMEIHVTTGTLLTLSNELDWARRDCDETFPVSASYSAFGVEFYALFTAERARENGCPEEVLDGLD
jgi:hypothetical protein